VSELLVVNYPPYHKTPVKPRNFADFCAMVERGKSPIGIWELVQSDPKTGRVKRREWNKNVVTDNGAINILASAIAATSNANPWNDLLITNNSASTTLTVATGVAAITSLSVAALPAALPANSIIQIGYGGGTTQNIPGPTSITAQGATTLTVPSFTPSINFPIGTAVVPVPGVTDNPTNANLTFNATTPLSQYSGALAGGAFVYTATTGAGNRNVVVTFTFKTAANGGSTAIGNYTDAWLVNVASGAANTTTGLFVGNYIAHEINTPMRCDNSNNVTCTVTIKL
jgi:hypothetical protein